VLYGTAALDDVLVYRTFTVSGLIHSSFYPSSVTLGYTNLGSGMIQQYMFVSPEAFSEELPYTEVFVTVDGARGLLTLDDDYQACVDEVAGRTEDMGLGELVVFNRAGGKSWGHAQETVDRINEHSNCKARLCDLNDHELLRAEMDSASMLMNTTNVGMGALEGQSVIPEPSFFHEGMVVQDAIYAPRETKLLSLAREAGCKTINGISMLFYQGVKQYELWTGLEMPLTVDDFEVN
jgi:hypothetical protein